MPHSESSPSATNGHGLVSNGHVDQTAQPLLDTEEFPVIIVGAGPVGLLLALRLAQSNIRSVVLEQQPDVNQAPRAIGYYGPIHTVFQEAGIYDRVAKDGMPAGGYVWRKLLSDDETGNDVHPEQKNKKLGSIIGWNIMSRPDFEGNYEVGHYSIQLAQSDLCKILLEEAAKTRLVKVFWGHGVTDLTQDGNGVAVSVAIPDGGSKSFRGQYLAACDGGRSTIRKLLGIRLSGHSWPERFLATDVLRTAPVVADPPVHFTVDPKYWGVVTPLEAVEAGKRGLWRYSMAVPPGPDGLPMPEEEILKPEHVDSLLLRQIDGPRPSDHIVVRKSVYKMHQLLASTMHRGRCFLAGDSAHINNPIGGLGLCTGLLDADALHQTLVIAFSSQSVKGIEPSGNDVNQAADLQKLFGRYSAERRRIFQNIIHPFSSANKTRLHGGNADDVAREDWYFQALARGDPKELKQIHAPLFDGWRTDMSKLT
ncbi:Fc.00g104290.m01.CDS01 [Cosmosporella sp. VM-42]